MTDAQRSFYEEVHALRVSLRRLRRTLLVAAAPAIRLIHRLLSTKGTH